MNKEENVEELIRTIQFSEIAQKGYKVMSNDEFERIVNGVLNLQQENEKLKEKLMIATKMEIKEIDKYTFVGIDYYVQKNQELQEENEKLNHYKLLYQKVKDRNDKAIEYVDDNVAVYAFNNKDLPHWEFNDDDIEMLLEILKGNNETE